MHFDMGFGFERNLTDRSETWMLRRPEPERDLQFLREFSVNCVLIEFHRRFSRQQI
ncbi:MAG: hypothetical protein FD144_3346 [Rhodospirillaceae bacterium]|nr:MAG: hypothetical protein FD144_3346 [Rhodospirillaceae bacterium]